MSNTEVSQMVQASWHGFLETYEPLRGELYRYCRALTRSPWDAEDLAQDTLARAFVTLGQMGEPPPNPRAWLFRVASNLWIDRLRRVGRERADDSNTPKIEPAPDPRGAREAAGTLLGTLAPQERAAVVLKDAFDLSLAEVAEALSTTVGSVKSALHRARSKLVEPPPEVATPPPPPLIDAFCKAFNAGDLDRLTELLLDSAQVEVVGATTQYGREAARRTVLAGMLFGAEQMAAAGQADASQPNPFDPRDFAGVLSGAPRVEARAHRGQWVLLHWYQHRDTQAVRALTRLEIDAGSVVRLLNYFYNVELIEEIGAELEVPTRSNGRRWWLPSGAKACGLGRQE